MKNYTQIISLLILLFITIGGCRREAPDLMSELPNGSNFGSSDGKKTGQRLSSAEEVAFLAVQSGDIETLKKELSSERVKIYTRSTSTGKSLLETAVQSGSMEIVDFLIELDPNVVYGELISIINESRLIDEGTRRALLEKITTGKESEEAINLALLTMVETGLDDLENSTDLDAIENLLFAKGADVTLTDFFNIPSSSDQPGYITRLGINLLYKALGCKRYFIEWIVDEQPNGETEVELDYFDLDCSGIRKPNFIRLLIEAGVDFTQKVVFFDELTSFENLLSEVKDDFSSDEYDQIIKILRTKLAPLHLALGCKSVYVDGSLACDIKSAPSLTDEKINKIVDLLSKGADPFFETNLLSKSKTKNATFYTILKELKKAGKIGIQDYNNLIATAVIYAR